MKRTQESRVGMVFSAAALALALAFPSPALAGDKTYGDFHVIINDVHDGDTIYCDIPGAPPIVGDRIGIRLRGIDTPEMRGPGPHDEARALVLSLCPVGSTAQVKNASRDKYFRLGGDVYCGGADVAKHLLDAGLAHPYDGGTKEPWDSVPGYSAK